VSSSPFPNLGLFGFWCLGSNSWQILFHFIFFICEIPIFYTFIENFDFNPPSLQHIYVNVCTYWCLHHIIALKFVCQFTFLAYFVLWNLFYSLVSSHHPFIEWTRFEISLIPMFCPDTDIADIWNGTRHCWYDKTTKWLINGLCCRLIPKSLANTDTKVQTMEWTYCLVVSLIATIL